mmetsp:Transcript_42604/g.121955  ORF Transcript_42604/g.121955 Transcript_42604/m.121955 type:complete len:207 (+) Transcript_42604:206-826(+)
MVLVVVVVVGGKQEPEAPINPRSRRICLRAEPWKKVDPYFGSRLPALRRQHHSQLISRKLISLQSPSVGAQSAVADSLGSARDGQQQRGVIHGARAHVRVLAVRDRSKPAILANLPNHNATQASLQSILRFLLDRSDTVEADGGPLGVGSGHRVLCRRKRVVPLDQILVGRPIARAAVPPIEWHTHRELMRRQDSKSLIGTLLAKL